MARYAEVHASPSTRVAVTDPNPAATVVHDFALATLDDIPGTEVSLVLPPSASASVARRLGLLALAASPFATVEFARRLGYVTRLIVPFPGRVPIYLVDELNAQITDESGNAIELATV